MEYNYPLVQYLSTYSVLGILLIFCCIIWILEQNIKFIHLILKIVNRYLRSDSETSDPKSTKEEQGGSPIPFLVSDHEFLIVGLFPLIISISPLQHPLKINIPLTP